MARFRIACLYDVHLDTPNGRILWAFGRRVEALRKFAPADFSVDIFQFSEVPWHRLGEYQAVFNLEYSSPSRERIPPHVLLICAFNSDSNRRREWWPRVRQAADWVIANNYDAWSFYGKQPGTCVISNGIDVEIFKPVSPISSRAHRVLWAGSSNPVKGKNLDSVIRPLEERLVGRGFEFEFRPINKITPAVYNTQQQVDWYNSGSYVLCASDSEGTPNLILEGMACGCVPVTVPVGNALEMGVDRENCVLVERNTDSFIQGLEYAREHRERLSDAAVKTMQGWSYGPPGNRAQYFYALFRRLIEDGPDSVKPFAYNEKHWSEI